VASNTRLRGVSGDRSPLNRPASPEVAQDLELSVVSALMLDPSRITDVLAVLDTNDLLDPRLRPVLRVMGELAANGHPVDLRVLADELDHRGELEAAGVGLRQIRRACEHGELAEYLIGGWPRVSWPQVLKWIEAQGTRRGQEGHV
jgi:hypothetical protein